MIRLFPAAEFRVFGYLVPSPFLPAVDARVRDRPGRTAVGVWAVAQTGLLLFAASDDLIARWLKAPVEDVIAVLRIVVLAGPPVIAAVAYVLTPSTRASRPPGAAPTRPTRLLPPVAASRPPAPGAC
ncbi:hypothetical protein ACI2LC_33860 [Nonomuraea wenchangensis]|uniref:hypothetical protein n=1 Tax=Nonomuraea wenchangensis TaxID=568860 RepID=UPI00384B59BD